MNTLFSHVANIARSTGARLVLGAAIAGTAMVSTAQAHHGDVVVELRPGGAQIARRVWVEPVVQERTTQVWVEATCSTVPESRTWVPAEYRTVTDHVWREPVVRQDQVQVWVPACHQDRRIEYGGRFVRMERAYVPGHYETQTRQCVVTPGHYEDVARQELVCDGHWQVTEQQVVNTPAHFETRVERVVVCEGHWDSKPLITLR